MIIELGKDDQYQTRDGRPVRIHAVDIARNMSVLYSVKIDGQWFVRTANASGRWSAQGKESDCDIVMKPTIRKLVINIYSEDYACCAHSTDESADGMAGRARIGKLRVRFRDCDFKDGVIELQSWEEPK